MAVRLRSFGDNPAPARRTAPLGESAWLPEYMQRRTSVPTDSLESRGGSGRLARYAATSGVDIEHRKWSSTGDPHIRMGKERYDEQAVGNLTILKSSDGSFMVESRQDHPAGAPNVTVNTKVAIRDGDTVVRYDADTDTLKVNGKPWDGTTRLPGGTEIAKTDDGYQIVSARGDVTNIRDRGNYLDLDGEIARDREVGELRGAFGSFDNVDDASSHLRRDGTVSEGTDALAEDWKTRPDEELFEEDRVEAGGGPGRPVFGLFEALARLLSQLADLLGRLTRLLGGRFASGDREPEEAGASRA